MLGRLKPKKKRRRMKKKSIFTPVKKKSKTSAVRGGKTKTKRGNRMKFTELKALIKNEAENKTRSFDESSEVLKEKIFRINSTDLKSLITEVGVIPEDIGHDSTEEKLFSKATDIVLAKTLQELGLSASVNKERANCADVIAKSNIHDYTLVGDAKAFRLSRTAKNQKDFKVKSMVDWKGDNDYSVLVCPFYQYPKSNSQIYGQALDNNVCLLSWEHLLLLLEKDLKETKTLNLSNVWNISDTLASKVTIKNKDRNTNFHESGNQIICNDYGINFNDLSDLLKLCRSRIIQRGEEEIEFWENKIEEIHSYSREQAIKELLSALKLREKISAIKKYIDSLKGDK